MTAADILRERAQKADDIIAAYGLCHPDELRALADLVEAQISISGYCNCCGLHVQRSGHKADCPLAAVERAFKGDEHAESE